MFKGNNRKTRTMCEIWSMSPMSSFWCLYCKLLTYITLCSSVSIVNFEQVNVVWVPS